MIKTETVIIDNREFVRTYSDEGKYVVREGISYEEAYDPAEFNRTYTEGDIIVHNGEVFDDMELSDDQIASILTGGTL